MINIFINSGHSFFSLRENLVKFLLNRGQKICIYSPNNINKIKKKFTKNVILKKIFISSNKLSLINLIYSLLSIKKKFVQNDINLIFGTYLNLIF